MSKLPRKSGYQDKCSTTTMSTHAQKTTHSNISRLLQGSTIQVPYGTEKYNLNSLIVEIIQIANTLETDASYISHHPPWKQLYTELYEKVVTKYS